MGEPGQDRSPPSYDRTGPDRRYPVLWITDDELDLVLPIVEDLLDAGKAPELILVSVGAVPDLASEDAIYRRGYEFGPGRATSPGRMGFSGPQGDYLERQVQVLLPAEVPTEPAGADAFLAFLVDELRGELAQRYRMDPADHALVGMSGGGMFVGYALFARPGAFSRYLCGSPSLNANDHVIFEAEEHYAATHDDLPASVFFCAGDGELTEEYITAWGCVSSMARLIETLHVRHYPSLRMTAKIYPDARHSDIWPLLIHDGLPHVWTN